MLSEVNFNLNLCLYFKIKSLEDVYEMMIKDSLFGSNAKGSRLEFALHVFRGRWLSLYASFTIMAAVGSTYVFGIYSKEIKASLGYDQSTLNLIGFFKDLGSNVGIISGLIAEVTPTWFLLLIANSLNFANTGVLVTCVKNFPENRGVLLGLLKGFAGLSGAIMTQIYLALYGNDPQSLILLIAWLPAAVSLVFVYTIRTINAGRQQNEVKVLYQFLYVSIVLALFIMVMIITQKLVTFSPVAYDASATLVCGLLIFPLFIVFRKELFLWNQNRISTCPNDVRIEIPAQTTTRSEEMPKTSCFSEILKKPPRGEDYTILQALLSVDMLIVLISTACGIGSNLTAIDNLGQIGESLGYPTKTINSFVSLVSIWNYFGRIFAGSVYVASVIIGFSFGAQFPLLNAIISELFGLKHYATLFNVGQLASPVGSYLLNGSFHIFGCCCMFWSFCFFDFGHFTRGLGWHPERTSGTASCQFVFYPGNISIESAEKGNGGGSSSSGSCGSGISDDESRDVENDTAVFETRLVVDTVEPVEPGQVVELVELVETLVEVVSQVIEKVEAEESDNNVIKPGCSIKFVILYQA
ncbi:Protein nuclear fusion defective 4 [Heracleum sosnowskyi]|uniref:Protein nuclear fusion defective 4 n=1 Tax=Heracleum sosnowskyi TaxID=360622 RepID=A0AAD8MI15_9APIA|nr:Protein nuclear fusion defective 4 [Heracleum sosnowskyi]